MKKLLAFVLIVVFCVSLAACQVTPEEPSSIPEESSSELISEEPSSEPVSQEPSSEEESSVPQGSGGLPFVFDNNVFEKFNWLEGSFVDYAEEHLGYDPVEKPIDGAGVWDILSFIDFLGYTKEDFIIVNNTFVESFGRPEYTDEEIDILFGDDERAKRELVSPFCIFIGEGPIVYDTPYYTAVWYAEHSVDEWIEVGTPREDMIRLHDRLEGQSAFGFYWEKFEEKYKEFLDRVKE